MSTALSLISSVLHPYTCPCCGTITDAEDELIAPYRAMNLNVINR